jgi:hypothetical protein
MGLIARKQDHRYHVFYLDAPSDNFLSLYRERFMPKLLRSEVKDRVEDYYADILADELGQSELTKGISDTLRRRETRPDSIAQRIGLMESEFIRRLGEKLGKITEREDFARVFLLLRRPEFEDAVWEWLCGNEPDPVLRERGIGRPIDTDAAALEAIGVFSFLFGQLEHRFVLIIDEMEKVLSHSLPRRPDEATLLALKKLMEVISTTGALFVMSGLPDFLEVLPKDAEERISCKIRPSPMTGEEVVKYIREAQQRATGKARLEPYSRETADYIATISGGNARKVVRLCFLVYATANSSGKPITPAMIREVARDQFEVSSIEDVHSEIARVISQRGWLFERGKVYNKKTRRKEQQVTCDFWLPLGNEGAGICIFLSRSVIQKADVQRLASDVALISENLKPRAKILSLLVVNGYLAENLRGDLEKVFTRVLTFKLREFFDDCDAILQGFRLRLEESGREDLLASIKARIDEVARQNNAAAANLDSVFKALLSERDVQMAVTTGLRTFFGQLAGRESISAALPPGVDRVFRTAEASLTPFANVAPEAFDLIFAPLDGRRTPELEMKMPPFVFDELIGGMRSPTLAAVYLLPIAIEKFKQQVSALLSNAVRGSSLRMSGLPSRLSVLENACMAFDRIVHQLSPGLQDADRLFAVLGSVSAHSFATNRLSRSIDRDFATTGTRHTVQVLESLGREVYDASRGLLLE